MGIEPLLQGLVKSPIRQTKPAREHGVDGVPEPLSDVPPPEPLSTTEPEPLSVAELDASDATAAPSEPAFASVPFALASVLPLALASLRASLPMKFPFPSGDASSLQATNDASISGAANRAITRRTRTELENVMPA